MLSTSDPEAVLDQRYQAVHAAIENDTLPASYWNDDDRKILKAAEEIYYDNSPAPVVNLDVDDNKDEDEVEDDNGAEARRLSEQQQRNIKDWENDQG